MKRTGRKPFGYYPDEASVIEVIKIKRRARKGSGGPESPAVPTSPAVIARELNAERYKTQTGRPWYPRMVKRILDRLENPPPKDDEKKKQRTKTRLESDDYLTAAEVQACRAVFRRDNGINRNLATEGTEVTEGKRLKTNQENPVIPSKKRSGNGDEVLFETLLGSGLRASELCALQIKDLGLYRGKSQIDVRRGKGAKNRAVKIGPRLRRRLRLHLAHNRQNAGRQDPVFLNSRRQPLTYRNLYYAIGKLGERARVSCLHPHTLRHTFGTHLYNYTKSLLDVKEQLGHASVKTTEIYAHVLPEGIFEQMAGFEKKFDI